MARNHIEHPDKFNEHYSAHHIEAVKRIINWLNESESRTQSHMSKCTGKSTSYISQLIKGILPVDPTELINACIGVVEDTPTDVPEDGFIQTSVFKLISHACGAAKTSGRFAVTAGSPGVGKSTALKKYAELVPGTIYLLGSEVTTGTVILDRLVDALSVRQTRLKTKSDKTDAIIEKLSSSKRLIILDEADKCQKDSIDPLRTISDQTGCGVVLAGNVQLRHDIKAGTHRFDLLSDRVVFWPQEIHSITLEDCCMLLRQHITDEMITSREDFATIAKYAHELTGGSARKLINALLFNVRLVYQQNKDNGARISCDMMRDISKRWMGVINPPPVPQHSAAVPVPNS